MVWAEISERRKVSKDGDFAFKAGALNVQEADAERIGIYLQRF